MKHCVEIHFYC